MKRPGSRGGLVLPRDSASGPELSSVYGLDDLYEHDDAIADPESPPKRLGSGNGRDQYRGVTSRPTF